VLADVLDDLHEFVQPVALETGEVDELSRTCNDGASLGGAGDGDAAPAPELEQLLVSEYSQGSQHRVRVDAKDCGEVFGGRQSLARPCLAFRDRATNLSGDLLVEIGAIATSRKASNGPRPYVSTRAVTSASRPSATTTTSPGSRFGAKCSKGAEVVAGRVVHAVAKHSRDDDGMARTAISSMNSSASSRLD